MTRGLPSKPFRLGRAKKVLGVPMTKAAMNDIKQAVKDVMMNEKTPQKDRRERIEICNNCEHKKGNRCNLCGCFISYKINLKHSICPIGKWGSSSVTESTIDNPSEESSPKEESH